MALLALLIAVYLLLGLALAVFVTLWLMAYRLGVREVVTGKGAIVLASAYRRRLSQLARGRVRDVLGRLSWLCVYAVLAWPWLFLALFYENRRHI